MVNKQLLLESLKGKMGQPTKEPAEKNPYNQKEIEQYINNKNYAVEGVPKLSEIAASLSAPKEETKEEAPKKTLEIKEEDLEMLQNFINKYKGKK